jgi:UDP-glucose 4-epimerase
VSVLVTGGAGFIGSHLIDRLLREGYDVVVVDDLSSGKVENLNLKNSNLRLLRDDIRDKKFVKKALKDVEVVFHLAAIVDVEFSVKNPLLVNEVNVGGSLNILDESVRRDVTRFVYASSCAVYGDPIYLPIDEEHPRNPLSPYAASKFAAEEYCQVFNKVYGLSSSCLRFFNVYGPRQGSGSYSGVVSRFIQRLKMRKAPIIFGDGLQTRDFVYVEDVVNAIFKVLHSKQCAGEKINIGSGKETSIRELADALIKKFSLKDVKPKYVKSRVGDIKRSCGSVEKAKCLLGYEPSFSLDDGLENCMKRV